ncbi:antibiotic biosynthesis monooxygenase [Geodermatophilus sp. YIM 151500]|uniref:putative quinol monooxygenase n=1 Tax=Geodermatophilus sp. YIM 151500 TaxID=2984531 RepID=UPI0021E4C819|nr:putative quinol monooxygenase [Geodermatophilus sp. YIM 151500]MCV2488144.1 antibiotic biosynthesis monooxygenase [Geodermatophilus sp. YIM 151500]
MFSLTVQLEVRPEGREEFLAAITTNAEASVRDEPGCHRFDVCAVEGDGTRFVLHELYDDAEAFEAHKRAPHFAAWRRVADRVLASQVNTRGTLIAAGTDRARP